MTKIKYEGILEAKTPIFHGGDEKTGSTPVLRTITIFNDGRFEVIPYISGNSIRGKLRRLAFLDLFTRLGYEPNLKLHHILYSGGVLESVEEDYGVIDLGLRKTIRETLPLLALFGSSIGNQVLSGKLQVGHAFPICKEYASFLPEKLQFVEQAKESVRLFTGDTFITRRAEIPRQDKDEDAVQMKVDYECFIPGTLFYHFFALDYPNDVELSCFGHIMNLFLQTPFLGGRSSQGDGEIRFSYEPEFMSPDLYLSFIEEKKKEIIAVLDFIGGTNGNNKEKNTGLPREDSPEE
jgi:CRISPR/Cas system CSM-associated protein Csm3 (group 7 of RAMP superfamily)